jgi:hypothetical protein
MDIKDCGIKTPAERSIRYSDISVGTGKSAIPYETAQCSARTEFPVLASPRPFSCFYAVLHCHTSICTRGLLDFRRTMHARSHFHHAIHARSLFLTRPRLLAVRTPMPARISAACSPFPAPSAARSPFPGFPHAHARSHFCCALAVSHTPVSRFLLRLALPPPPRASPPPRLPSALPHSTSPRRQSQARRRAR